MDIYVQHTSKAVSYTHLERQPIREHSDFNMLAFPLTQTDAHPGDPYEQEFPQLFRPGQRIAGLPHDDLDENDDDHQGKHGDDDDFFNVIQLSLIHISGRK